jgi:hypothetical protein
MALQGDKELRARLKAIRQASQPIVKSWAADTVVYAKAHVPARTGTLRKSLRIRNASQRGATLVGAYWANFIDAGTRAHDERPKSRKAMRYGSPGSVRFAKRIHHPRTGARPFKRAAAEYGLRKNPMAATVLKLWNDAA